MRVLVVGTSGQLAMELQRQGQAFPIELLPPVKLDLTDAGATRARLDQTRPKLVINASAYTAVDRAETESVQAQALNAEGPARLAQWCDAENASLFHVSTDYVFDGQKPTAYTEQDGPAPLGVYGRTKLEGEQLIRGRLERHLILRTSWVFSAHGQNFVKTMLRLARERDELRVVADQRGKPTAASALARALLTLATRLASGAPLPWGTYHFAGDAATTWHGFAQAIVDAQAPYTGRKPLVTAIASSDYPTPATRPANSTLDTTLFEQTFALQAPSWRDDLREVIREIVAH
ncbi:MAG: dTDP-4-dehydrorhamnose reductase [Myxococcales bacterium]